MTYKAGDDIARWYRQELIWGLERERKSEFWTYVTLVIGIIYFGIHIFLGLSR